MLPSTNKELKSYENAKVFYICKKYLIKNLFKYINHRKVTDNCYYSSKYRGMLDEIPVLFRNDWKYDYHFIIKKLANEFEGPFECIGENSEIYKKISVMKIDKDSN